jgi:hypothetical protein
VASVASRVRGSAETIIVENYTGHHTSSKRRSTIAPAGEGVKKSTSSTERHKDTKKDNKVICPGVKPARRIVLSRSVRTSCWMTFVSGLSLRKSAFFLVPSCLPGNFTRRGQVSQPMNDDPVDARALCCMALVAFFHTFGSLGPRMGSESVKP